MTEPDTAALVEQLAREFHAVYQDEARRQGDVRHADAYDDLPENVKEFDRVLARYVMKLQATLAQRLADAEYENASLRDGLADAERECEIGRRRNQTMEDAIANERHAVTSLRQQRDAAQARADKAEAALREIAKVQPAVMAYIRANGFTFSTPLHKPDDERTEAERWEKLAFSIYTDLCDIQRVATPTEEPGQ